MAQAVGEGFADGRGFGRGAFMVALIRQQSDAVGKIA
jgi:hypothetical protein